MATWFFAPDGGGEAHGFHNAGVETFKGNTERYLAREAIQNSVDARNDLSLPVKVDFQLVELDRDDILGMDDLQKTIKRCALSDLLDKNGVKFFQQACQIASEIKIPALRIRDIIQQVFTVQILTLNRGGTS